MIRICPNFFELAIFRIRLLRVPNLCFGGPVFRLNLCIGRPLCPVSLVFRDPGRFAPVNFDEG